MVQGVKADGRGNLQMTGEDFGILLVGRERLVRLDAVWVGWAGFPVSRGTEGTYKFSGP